MKQRSYKKVRSIIHDSRYIVRNNKRIKDPHWKKQELKFIHVPKNAGLSIEQIGLNNNILWGRSHSEKGDYGYYHESFFAKREEMKRKYDWFMVCRNPYDRVLSAWLWLLQIEDPGRKKIDRDFKNYCNLHDSNEHITNKDFKNKTEISVGFFNHNIKEILTNLPPEMDGIHRDKNYPYLDTCPSENKIFILGEHFSAQYVYFDTRWCRINVIRFENLKEEFENLMIEYNMPHVKMDLKINNTEKIFTIDDMDDELINLINWFYYRDFDIFQYPMIDTNRISEQSNNRERRLRRSIASK